VAGPTQAVGDEVGGKRRPVPEGLLQDGARPRRSSSNMRCMSFILASYRAPSWSNHGAILIVNRP